MTATVRAPAAPRTSAADPSGSDPQETRRHRRIPSYAAPTVVAAVSAIMFAIVQPNVSDLQAALARESAADHGVGLGYWFQWFGGGSTPGNYSVIVPYLSSLVSAAVVGALATIASTPLAYRALAGTRYRTAAVWLATLLLGMNLWSGRVPFALGCATGLVAIIGAREKRRIVAVVGIVASSLCSPVSGAFVAFGFGAAILTDRVNRRMLLGACLACGATLLFIGWYFGNPGPQGFPRSSAVLTAVAAFVMLAAKPHPVVRVALWCTVVAVPIVALVPNGLGSNLTRLSWICLPAAVLATATARRRIAALAVVPAILCCADVTVNDLVRSSFPSASSAYYGALIGQLDDVADLRNYRLEVVQDPLIHSAANVLLDHAALAGGWETQEQHKLNPILNDRVHLNATTYRIWLDNNAVGYVALNLESDTTDPEYQLMAAHRPDYVTEVSRTKRWALYRVLRPTPIVPKPAQLLSASQAEMRVDVPCACRFYVRVRYSKFLHASTQLRESGGAVVESSAKLTDDGNGWTIVTTYAPGTYVFAGDFTRRLSN